MKKKNMYIPEQYFNKLSNFSSQFLFVLCVKKYFLKIPNISENIVINVEAAMVLYWLQLPWYYTWYSFHGILLPTASMVLYYLPCKELTVRV